MKKVFVSAISENLRGILGKSTVFMDKLGKCTIEFTTAKLSSEKGGKPCSWTLVGEHK